MKSKVILVSGASSGIGYHTANFLSSQGHQVIGLSRSYPKEKYDFDYLLCDITKEEHIAKIKTTISEKYGHLDILVNAAGFGISGPIEYTSKAAMKKLYEVNVFGHVVLTNHLLDLLKQSKQAKIINISSVASDLALPFQAFYSMTKASIDAYTKALSLELKPFNIQVAAVLPGDIKTGFTEHREKPSIDENDVYYKRYLTSLERMEKDEMNGMSPLRIAKRINRLINKRHMPLRSTVGLSYKLIRVLYKLLPERFVFWAVKKLYG